MRTFGKIGITDHRNKKYWEISEVPPYVSIKLKDMFRSIPRTGTPPYLLPVTDEISTDIHWFMQRYAMEISPSDLRKMKRYRKRYNTYIDDNYQILQSDYVPTVDLTLNEGQKLFEYQKVAVELSWKVKRLLIADEVGLGKTPEGIATLLDPKWLPAIIVVQPHLLNQWRDEIEKFTKLKVHIIHTGKNYELPPCDVYIIKYTIIAKWMHVLRAMGLKTIILDEVQEVRRSESAKHDGCKKVAEVVPNIIGLSGTPIVNYGGEIFNIYSVIRPSLFPDRDVFNREWCSYKDRISDPKALGAYLRDQFAYIRRTKIDVGSEIPPINKIVHTVDYNKSDIDKMNAEAKVLAITMMQGSFIERGQASRELSIMVRKSTGVAKARSVADYVKVILQNDEKVLLMGFHRDVYDIWLDELSDYNCVMYTGSETYKEKEANKKAFIEGDTQVMIMSLRAGSSGLDGLQHVCQYIVFGELDWSGVLHDQAIGRLYRKGQEGQVTAIFLVSDSGSDPIVSDIIGLKKSQQEGILNPLSQGQRQFSDDSIIKEFAKKLITKK